MIVTSVHSWTYDALVCAHALIILHMHTQFLRDVTFFSCVSPLFRKVPVFLCYDATGSFNMVVLGQNACILRAFPGRAVAGCA